MIYVTTCPKCHETVSFLNNEEMKTCRNCGEVVINTKILKTTNDTSNTKHLNP